MLYKFQFDLQLLCKFLEILCGVSQRIENISTQVNINFQVQKNFNFVHIFTNKWLRYNLKI